MPSSFMSMVVIVARWRQLLFIHSALFAAAWPRNVTIMPCVTLCRIFNASSEPPSMSLILEAVLPLFALILAGWVAGRRRILGASATDSLNTFVVWMALPALLFQAMALISWEEIRQPGFIAASAIAMAAVFGVSFLADRRKGRRLADASPSSLAAAYGNAGYMGIALCIMVLGEASLPAVIIITLLTACIMFAFSIVLIELDLQRSATLGGTLRKVGLSVLRNPLVCSPLAGLFVSGMG